MQGLTDSQYHVGKKNLRNEVIIDNPFACIAYMTAGENKPAVEKTWEAYTVKVFYQNDARPRA